MERKGGLQYVRSGANNDFHAPTSIDMVYIYIYIYVIHNLPLTFDYYSISLSVNLFPSLLARGGVHPLWRRARLSKISREISSRI